MKQYSKQTKQHADYSVMESGSHFKNGASSKNRISSNNLKVSFLILCLLIYSGAFTSYAQIPNNNVTIYSVVEKMPSFPGGDSELLSFIEKNVKYPVDEIGMGKNIEGRVTLRFVVKENGSIGDIQVIRSLEPHCDAEAIRVIKAMPNWIPGMQNGKPVNVYYNLPVSFKNPAMAEGRSIESQYVQKYVSPSQVGLDNSWTVFWKVEDCVGSGVACDGNVWLAYRFVGNTDIEFKHSSSCNYCDMVLDYVSSKDWANRLIYYGVDAIQGYTGSNNIAKFYDVKNISPTCFETGKIPIRYWKTDEVRYIALPQSMLDYRNSLYKTASAGTIYDLLKYEDTYYGIDSNTKTLQERKNKMLYTTEYFDDQSEKYKNDLYLKVYQDAYTWDLKNSFREKYAQYDPQKYIAAMPPIDITKKLAYYENLASSSYSFQQASGLFGMSISLNKSLYNSKKTETQNAINSCKKDMSDYPKYSKEFSTCLNSLDYQLSDIESVFQRDKEYLADLDRRAESSYQQKKAEEKAEQIKKCAECEVDYEKFTLPKKEDWIICTNDKPGKIIMKNGETYEYYYDKNKGLLVKGFVWDDKYDNFDEMIRAFIDKCKYKFKCPDN